MPSLALPVRASQPPAPAEIARARLLRLPFPPDATIGIPYYDDEFDMAQSKAHAATVRDLGSFLDRLAVWTGLSLLSDNPVWYWIHEQDRQQILYPDYALALSTGDAAELAGDLRLALEIVSTERPAKERKDSERMRDRNATNGVPEFGLIYPEPEDSRALRWFWLEPGDDQYREATLPPDRRFRSQAVPGLELEVLEPTAWRLGRKIRLWYRGERIPCVEEEMQRAELQAQRAEQEARRARQETLRAMQETQRAEQAAQRADQETLRAEVAEADNARLRALLRQAGLATKD
jgi:hypothetical protein